MTCNGIGGGRQNEEPFLNVRGPECVNRGSPQIGPCYSTVVPVKSLDPCPPPSGTFTLAPAAEVDGRASWGRIGRQREN